MWGVGTGTEETMNTMSKRKLHHMYPVTGIMPAEKWVAEPGKSDFLLLHIGHNREFINGNYEAGRLGREFLEGHQDLHPQYLCHSLLAVQAGDEQEAFTRARHIMAGLAIHLFAHGTGRHGFVGRKTCAMTRDVAFSTLPPQLRIDRSIRTTVGGNPGSSVLASAYVRGTPWPAFEDDVRTWAFSETPTSALIRMLLSTQSRNKTSLRERIQKSATWLYMGLCCRFSYEVLFHSVTALEQLLIRKKDRQKFAKLEERCIKLVGAQLPDDFPSFDKKVLKARTSIVHWADWTPARDTETVCGAVLLAILALSQAAALSLKEPKMEWEEFLQNLAPVEPVADWFFRELVQGAQPPEWVKTDHQRHHPVP